MRSATYISTRGGLEPVPFCDAVLMGLGTDGGLLLPAEIPDVTGHLAAWRDLPYPELAAAVMTPFVGTGLSAAQLTDVARRSYATFSHPEVVPLRRLGPLFLLELFHGPTLAFKDVALQFLGNLFSLILNERRSRLTILGATSGDTGSAAIYGVRGKRNIEIFIMHPRGRVSPVQERQMTTVPDANVHNIAIRGTFDDGQRVLKAIFNDLPFKSRYKLGAVNSVNWARVMAQVVYYFHAAFRATTETSATEIQVAVPTGNFGDIFAGYIARRMGAPIRRLILATNENDILARFFCNGVYRRGTVQPTISPSMDIQVASNFERYLYYRVGESAASVSRLMQEFQDRGEIRVPGQDPAFVAGSADTDETRAVIRRYYRDFQVVLDPHTAVGVAVAEQMPDRDLPTVCLATAHPAKFNATIREALGHDAARHPTIDALMDLPCRSTILPADADAVKDFIRTTLEPAAH